MAGVQDTNAHRLTVEAWRGDHVESRHEVWCAAAPGVASSWAADAALLPVTFMRSAAKPFQLVPLVAAGGAERFALDDADLAIMAASHDGTDAHAARVAAILARIGLGPETLRCGVHRPYFLEGQAPDSPERLRVFGPLHNNCSGNHAAMLALGLLHGVDPEHYLDPRTPSQQRVHGLMRGLSGVEPDVVSDNCAAPCYGMPLASMAETYGFLARPKSVHELRGARRAQLERLGDLDRIAMALDRIGAAMASQPEWVSGPASGATRLARLAPGELVVKYGAEGVLCVAHRGCGAALALKVTDGAARALLPALMPLVGELGWWPGSALARLQDVAEPVLRGCLGQTVGRLRAAPAR